MKKNYKEPMMKPIMLKVGCLLEGSNFRATSVPNSGETDSPQSVEDFETVSSTSIW